MVVNDPALIAAPETTKVYRAGSVIRKGPYPAAGRRTAHEDYSTVRQNRYGRAAHLRLRLVFGWRTEVRAQSVVPRRSDWDSAFHGGALR